MHKLLESRVRAVYKKQSAPRGGRPRLTSPLRPGRIAGNTIMYEDFTDSSSMPAAVAEAPPSVSRIAHEMDALQAAIRVADGEDDLLDEARLLCRTYLARLEPSTIEEYAIDGALRRILNRQVSAPDIEPASGTRSWETFVAETVALAWFAWAADDEHRCTTLLDSLRSQRRKEEVFTDKTGALHLYTLYFWSQATTLLVADDLDNARRFFKRAIELGSQFGTESHPMISWAYAASFRR